MYFLRKHFRVVLFFDFAEKYLHLSNNPDDDQEVTTPKEIVDQIVEHIANCYISKTEKDKPEKSHKFRTKVNDLVLLYYTHFVIE